MKKLYIFIAAFMITLYGFLPLNAKTIIITADANNTFTPNAVLDAVVGDTIKWNWIGGIHTTTSMFIPPGAATWNANLDNVNTSFSYKITVAGAYVYQCTPHAGVMVGGFNATDPTGIIENNLNVSAVIYPNPFKERITIRYNNADAIAIYNMIGEKIKLLALEANQTKTEVDLTDIPAGVYFYSTMKEGVLVETKRVVKTQ